MQLTQYHCSQSVYVCLYITVGAQPQSYGSLPPPDSKSCTCSVLCVFI